METLFKVTMLTPQQLRILKTFNLYLSCAASGMCSAVTGPTLIELQNNVNTDTRNIAFIYTARSSGYLFGSLVGGVLFDLILRKQIGLIVFNLLMAVTMFAIPWSESIGMLTALMVLNGISLGALDTGMNAWCLNLWGKDSGPFFQAFHFTYGFGSLIAPLVAAPFIDEHNFQDKSFMDNNASATSQANVYDYTNETIHNITLPSTELAIPPVSYAYGIIGSLGLLITILFLTTCIIAPLDDVVEQNEMNDARKTSRWFVITVVFLNFLFLFMCTGNEIGYAQMLASYAVKGPLRLSASVGDYMTSTFWAAFTLSRFSSIFLAMKFSNWMLIVFDLIVTLVGSAVLLFLGGEVEWALWLASIILGIGIAPLFPTAVAWVDQYIPVTNKIVSVFTTGAAFGEMVIPLIVSHFLEEVPQILNYVISTSCVLSTVLAFVLYFVLRNKSDDSETQAFYNNSATT